MLLVIRPILKPAGARKPPRPWKSYTVPDTALTSGGGEMIEISGGGFLLRHFRKGDETDIVKYANNRKIYRATMAMPYPYSAGDARVWIEQNQAEARRKLPGMVSFAIDIGGEVVGCVGLSDIEGHKAAAGYWLAEPLWGRGITTRALGLATRYGFDEVGLRRIYAHVFPFNKASIRVLEKNAYKLEGRLRKESEKDGRLFDMCLYAKVR
jgi:ribosomal-protein-alanine N-acetyltransferase